MTDLELAVRTIQDMVSELPTEQLQKWKGILKTASLTIEKELAATYLHTCKICFLEEWGYRDELPSQWYKKGGAEVCFSHEYAESEKLLKDAGYKVDAFFPPEVPEITIGALRTTMGNLSPLETKADHTLEELMSIL